MSAFEKSFTAMIVAQMRNHELVSIALQELGFDPDDVEGLQQESARCFPDLHDVDAYSHWLGPPLQVEVHPENSPHRRVARYFQLALWPHLELVVYADDENLFGGMQFVRREPHTRPPSIGVWNRLIDELHSRWPGLEEYQDWWPHTDFSGIVHGRELNLCFDFGLLTQVWPVSYG